MVLPRRVMEWKGPFKGLLVAWKKAMLSNCGVFASREHGGPEGMDPDGVIEVRNGFGLSS